MLNLICCNFECSVSYACCCLPGSKRNYQLEPETHWCYYRGTNPKKSLILIILLLLCFGWSVGGLYAPIDRALLVHNLFSLVTHFTTRWNLTFLSAPYYVCFFHLFIFSSLESFFISQLLGSFLRSICEYLPRI